MKRPFGGFTIVEVLIVTAISAFLFISAMVVFGGKRQAAEFSQAMQDLSSTLQNYANEVTTGTFPEEAGLPCKLNGDQPYFDTEGGTNSHDCIFLGRLLEATPDKGTLSVYTIVGNGQVGTDFANSVAVKAVNQDGNDVLLDTYTLQGGTTIKSSQVNGADRDLIGLYTNFNSSSPSASQTHTSLVAKAYKKTDINKCVQEDLSCPLRDTLDASSPPWSLCITDGSRTAQLLVHAAPAGISADINFTPAEGDC